MAVIKRGVNFILFLTAVCSLIPVYTIPAKADHQIIIENIIEYNRISLEQSLADGTYRGEAGILRVDPRVAVSLGLKVAIDEEFIEAEKLLKTAENSFEKVKSAMSATRNEPSPGHYSLEIASGYISYKKSAEEAGKKLLDYYSDLSAETDERLDRSLCLRIMEALLDKSLEKTENRLRDALGYFYNESRGINGGRDPLTTENVRFVNFVFNGFVEQASPESRAEFDLDQDQFYKGGRVSTDWRDAAGRDVSRFVPMLEQALKKAEGVIYDIDPLLFIALMRRESGFNPMAISYLGAAGLTQIMPRTALALGMENIYMPDYFEKALAIFQEERILRGRAMNALKNIKGQDDIVASAEARSFMQESIKLGKERESLFNRYKKELLKDLSDDRLKAEKSIEFGLKYFAGLLEDQKGDISLALASYNAGPHRVREYSGIPPFNETVGFRNKVLKFYRDYVSMVND